MTSPTVSVIIPAYKAAQYIGETLDSVYAQTFTDYEIIVINDGSPDTGDLEKELKRYPSNLLYLKQENRGAAAARNTGIKAATGEFVAFLDADDTWLPNFLAEQLALIRSTNADLVYCDAMLAGDSPLAGRTFMQQSPSRGDVTPESLLAVTVTVLTSAVLARRQPILDVGMFDEGIKRGHDFDLWFRLAKAGARFAYHARVLAEHRVVESGLSGDTISQLERTLAVLRVIRTRKDLTAAENAALQVNWNRTLAAVALEKGKEKLLGRDFVGALKHFTEAKSLRRTWKVVAVCLGLRISPQWLLRFYLRSQTKT
jgi:glycosyltransferase involved in cell wall biosynthesis